MLNKLESNLTRTEPTQMLSEPGDETTQMKRQKLFETWESQMQTPPLSQLKNMALTPSPPIRQTKANDKLFYGLSTDVGNLFKNHRGIKSLYEWQDECLKLDCLNNEAYGNLLYLAPTSGGKTLIAEVSILKCLLLRKKSCIFILPFVAIVQEKVRAMQELAEDLGFYCEEYAHLKGQIPPIKRRKRPSLYICTIEKANSLVNSLIEANRLLEEVGLVAADEVHMIGDGSRGSIYEILLTKIKFMSKNQDIQIIATTATLQNKHEVAKYLNASLYERNYRPVELKEYVKSDKAIYMVDKKEDVNACFKLDRTINFSQYANDQMKTADPDFLIGLVLEVIPNSSCLIFCSTKRNCENVATLLAQFLPKELTQYKREQKLQLFHEIKVENAGQICPVLRKTLPFGIAYHHSGSCLY
jgi:POLQ-like helicase